MASLQVEQAHAAAAAFANRKPLMRVPSLFFTPEHRRAAHAVYAFFRTADDLVDEGGLSLEQFRAWRQRTQLPLDQQTDPFMLAWADTRARYNVDPAYENAVLDGLEMDLLHHRYETLDELKKYCYGVSTAPFLLAMSIVGFRPGVTFEQARPHIENMGIALQLTNLIRDVGRDLDIGRIYLPQAELARFGLTFADIEARRHDDRFERLMRHLTAIARDHYKAGWSILDCWSGSFRLAGGFGLLLYRSILNEAEKRHFDVFTHRIKAPVWKMFWLLATKWPAIYWTQSADKYF